MKKSIKIIIAVIVIIVLIIAINNSRKNDNQGIKIGVILPLSGPASLVGEDYKKGMDMAADEFGIKLNYQDGKASPVDSLNAAQQLYNSGNNIIMTAFRGASLSVASNFKGKKDVMVFSTTATSDTKAIGDYGSNFFAIGAEMLSNGSIDGLNAKNNCKNVVTLTEQTDAGKDKVKGFSDVYGVNKILLNETFLTDKADFKDIITKVKSYNPECVFIEIKSNYFKNFMTQLGEQGISPKVYTTSYSVNKDVANSLSDNQKSMVVFSSTTIYPDKVFSDKYFSKYNRYPNDFSLIGYEMIKVVYENQKECVGENTVECVASKLRQINNRDSYVGKISIDKSQEIKLRDNSLFKIVGNDFVAVE
jgi:branched-chain amino acid transport system substrate-binding protein